MIERKFLAHFINIGYGDEYEYVRLGKELEEFTPEMSATVDTRKNILGETSVRISGYEKTATVENYYAEEDSDLFLRLQEIIDCQIVGKSLITDVVEVKLWEQDLGNGYPAFREKVVIEITSYGGDASGYRIGFKLHYTGERERGAFYLDDRNFVEE